MNDERNKPSLQDFDIEAYREEVSAEYIEVLKDKKRADGLHWLKSERKNLESELEAEASQVRLRKQSLLMTLWEIFWGDFYCPNIDMSTPAALDEDAVDSALWAEGLHNFAVPQEDLSQEEQKEIKKNAIPYWNGLLMRLSGDLEPRSSASHYRATQASLTRLIDAFFDSLKIQSKERIAGIDMSLYTALGFHKRFSQKWERHMAAHMLAETVEFDEESYNNLLIEFNNKTAYGFHQSKADWVADTWKKERAKVSSDNKADDKVRQLYIDKFGLSISKRSIQRFTGR